MITEPPDAAAGTDEQTTMDTQERTVAIWSR